ncbi:MAG TPA: shikimate dehydrogenase [Candidatus Eisenbergiella intestinipullorum]|nr:shikimate dehydrogenase [Candidatus Eisenbergiella intestinipullorum]
MIDGKTAVCGLIGDPVEHTLSPVIHNTLAQETGKNLVYVPFPVKAEQVENAVKGARALSLCGLNVTVPHKSAVIPYLHSVEREAALIGAVNTLVPEGDGFRGYNTDLTGLGRALASDGVQLAGERVILLGAGGAARAAAFLCVLRGAKEVWLLNRTLSRAQALAQEVCRGTGRDCIRPLALSDWRKIPEGRYLAIQGTKVGLFPDTECAPIEEEAFYRLIHTGCDLIYRPARTKFMRLVEKAGGRAFNGLKMLLYQGVEAYELWTGAAVTEAQAGLCYERMKKELGQDG